MAVTLFTSRIVLQALGVKDFGIYNVVGGLSSSFIFFSSALTNSTQRYLNFELGKSNIDNVSKVFNLSLSIFTSIAVLIWIIGIPIGYWFIANKLVIPPEQVKAATIVLLCTVIPFGLIFIFSVYESSLIARENMKMYAYIGIFDAVSKLCIAYTIMHIQNNKLVVFAILMAIVQLIPKMYIAAYCSKHYPECKFRFYWDRRLFKDMFGFTGWNIYGSGVWMINEQGINILLNMLFGPAINAARGIAVQVNNAVNNFSTNFYTAVRPQIIKSYASGDLSGMKDLLYSSSRFSVYLLWIICLPLILKADYVLSIWLIEVPSHAVVFVQWILIYSIVNSLNNPIWTAVMAVGKLRSVVLVGSNIFLLAFPFSFILLKLGYDPYIVYPVCAIMRIAFLVVSIKYLQRNISISLLEFTKCVAVPIISVMLPSAIIMWQIKPLLLNDFYGLIGFVLISIIVSGISIYFLGVTHMERYKINAKLKYIYAKLKKNPQ